MSIAASTKERRASAKLWELDRAAWIGAARGLEGPLTSGRGGGSPRPERFVWHCQGK